MINDQDVSRVTPPHWTQNGAAAQAGDPHWRKPSPVEHFLGGSPVAVVIKLIFVSLIAGALMMWLGLRPADLVTGILRLIDRVWSLGFDAVREAWEYVAAGAMVVVPVWLVLRLLNLRQAR